MTNKETKTYTEFFNDLAKRHPLTSGLPVTLEFQPTLSYKDQHPKGIATLTNKRVRIQIATEGQNRWLILKNIAHEYRHAMQWVNMGWQSDNVSDPKMERDADLFGLAEVKVLMRGGNC